MQKYKLILIGWLLYSTLTFVGWQIDHMIYRWCATYNHAPIAQQPYCAKTFYSSWFYLGRALQFNPVSLSLIHI